MFRADGRSYRIAVIQTVLVKSLKQALVNQIKEYAMIQIILQETVPPTQIVIILLLSLGMIMVSALIMDCIGVHILQITVVGSIIFRVSRIAEMESGVIIQQRESIVREDVQFLIVHQNHIPFKSRDRALVIILRLLLVLLSVAKRRMSIIAVPTQIHMAVPLEPVP